LIEQWGYLEQLILAGYTEATFTSTVAGTGGGGYTCPVIYDPSNGTVSIGAIMRTNKGDITKTEPWWGGSL